MDTLRLDNTIWDLDLDQYGNLATAGNATAGNDQLGPGMRLAQDVATRVRAWLGEVYYDTTQGINYPVYLGGPPNLALLQSVFTTESLKVPECGTAIANFVFVGGSVRAVTGTITLSDTDGNSAQVTL